MEAREATATGESCMRVDAIAKVTGRARYTDDYVIHLDDSSMVVTVKCVHLRCSNTDYLMFIL